jgi:hypothetical protein
MLLFFPPIVQALIGLGALGAGLALHIAILDAIGCLGLVVGGYRLLRRRGSSGGTR